MVEKCWSKRVFLFAVNEALYRKEITVQKQKLIILEIRQTKSLTDGLPGNKTVDETKKQELVLQMLHWYQVSRFATQPRILLKAGSKSKFENL